MKMTTTKRLSLRSHFEEQMHDDMRYAEQTEAYLDRKRQTCGAPVVVEAELAKTRSHLSVLRALHRATLPAVSDEFEVTR